MQALAALFTAGRYDEAQTAARDLTVRYPRHFFGWKALGTVLSQLGHAQEALPVLEQALVLCPTDTDILNNLGKTLANLNRPAQAQTAYARALALKPDFAEAHNNLGCVFQELGRPKEAAQCYQRALALCPNYSTAWVNHAALLRQLGCFEEAEAAWRQVLALVPDHPDALPDYGGLLQLRGDLPAALDVFRRALMVRLRQPSRLLSAPPRPSFATAENTALLWQTLAQLAEAGIHAFATSGTLLGLVREGGLLAHDKDLDLALPYGELAQAHDCLVAHGWMPDRMNRFFLTPHAYQHDGLGVTLDLFGVIIEPSSTAMVSGIWLKGLPWEWQRVSEVPGPIRLRQIYQNAGLVWALEQPEVLLEAIYGPEWRIPDPDFDAVIAARNLRSFSLLTQCYAFSRIYSRWQKGQLHKALATTRHARRHLPEDTLLQQVEDHLRSALGATAAPVEDAP